MQMQSIRFMRSPGDDENEFTSSTEPTPAKSSEPEEPVTEGESAEEPFLEKIKDALRDWSNKDQADQDFDDTRV